MDTILDWLALTYTKKPLLLWVAGSVLAYTLATNALWFARTRDLGRPPYDRWLMQAARFAFYVGVPYLALGGWPRGPFKGLLSLEDMGLVGLGGHWPVTRWLETAGTALGFGLIALVFLLLTWVNANRGNDGTQLRFSAEPWWALLVSVLYLEVHWAFYRGALAIVLNDVYAGVLLGVGLVYLEWGLNPFWRQGWRLESRAAWQWLQVALALIVALLFLFTRNLWVCLVVHGSLALALWGLGRARATAGTVKDPSRSDPSSPVPQSPGRQGDQAAAQEQ